MPNTEIVHSKEDSCTYLLDDRESCIKMDRREFYKEQIDIFKKHGKPTRAIEIIHILMFNKFGELYIQKRADKSGHNAGLLDKSIGGHVQHGDPIDYTVMVETVQELQVPSIVLRSDIDFKKAFLLLHDYLNTVALLKHDDSLFRNYERDINGEKITIANKVHVFFGVYGGAVKTVDREARGVLLYTLEELGKEFEKFPDAFTQDLKLLIKEHGQHIQEFLKTIKSLENKAEE
ncbi:MAG: hypothetical protein ABIH21_01960 [Patescibacteria group bacterium]